MNGSLLDFFFLNICRPQLTVEKPRAIQWLKTLWARCGGIFMWQRQVDIYEASLHREFQAI